jgi:hypothetical protein
MAPTDYNYVLHTIFSSIVLDATNEMGSAKCHSAADFINRSSGWQQAYIKR